MPPPLCLYCSCFNPHPTRKPGATPVSSRQHARVDCFNPHPTRKPGATSHNPCDRTAHQAVSTLTRPESRVRLVLKWGDIETALVSTLTRPESRVRLHIRDISLGVHRVSTLTRPESRVRRSRKRLLRHIHELHPSP